MIQKLYCSDFQGRHILTITYDKLEIQANLYLVDTAKSFAGNLIIANEF